MKKFLILCFTFLITLLPAYTQNEFEYKASELYKQNVDSMLYVETQDSSGSGVIVKPDGTFVTCFHVIANADYINVKMNDGSMYKVNGFKYINPIEDIAILTLDSKRVFKSITIDPLNHYEIGEKVYAMSNPQGLQFVFSDGMLNQYNEEYIQFSAPISPGSSGGALLNERGCLIGIINSYLNSDGSQNINFAIPNKLWNDKLKNQTLIKKDNEQTWADFILYNADEDQFKLYTQYAMIMLNEGNFANVYKYVKPICLYYDENIPTDLYAFIGYLAIMAYIQEENLEDLKDAMKWFELSYKNRQNVEASALALIMIYFIFDEKEKGLEKLYFLETHYPIVYKKIKEIGKDSQNCKKYDDYCSAMIEFEILGYIGELISTEN